MYVHTSFLAYWPCKIKIGYNWLHLLSWCSVTWMKISHHCFKYLFDSAAAPQSSWYNHNWKNCKVWWEVSARIYHIQLTLWYPPPFERKRKKSIIKKNAVFKKNVFLLFLKWWVNLYLIINYFINLILLNLIWGIERPI